MVDVAWPEVHAALMTLATATFGPSVRVVDGFDLADETGDVVQIGVPNLSDVAAISAGNYVQTQMGHGASGVIEETGTIAAVAMAWSGDVDDTAPAAARTAAFGYITTLAAAVRANRSLGVTDFNLAVGTLTATGDIAQDRVNGATCAISFTVNYKAQIQAQ